MKQSRFLGVSVSVFAFGLSAPMLWADGENELACTSCKANQCAAIALVGGPCPESCCCCTVPTGGYSCTCQTYTHCLNTTGCYEGTGT